MYDIMAISLLYRLNDMIKCGCVIWALDPRLLVDGAALMGGHYRKNIISDECCLVLNQTPLFMFVKPLALLISNIFSCF
jgi:hypothetical protein